MDRLPAMAAWVGLPLQMKIFYNSTHHLELVLRWLGVGLSATDTFAFYLLDADSLLLSFNTSVTLGSVTYATSDIVRFDATSLGCHDSRHIQHVLQRCGCWLKF
jgi:hypothetical protein